ncbi:MAG TPA: hypothetical protein VG347_16315 [Verrucomicrobiae bacterium]|nr:hypothetical protein [Verrucomicrobiae bacterium]
MKTQKLSQIRPNKTVPIYGTVFTTGAVPACRRHGGWLALPKPKPSHARQHRFTPVSTDFYWFPPISTNIHRFLKKFPTRLTGLTIKVL